jgi:hypothetical protein
MAESALADQCRRLSRFAANLVRNDTAYTGDPLVGERLLGAPGACVFGGDAVSLRNFVPNMVAAICRSAVAALIILKGVPAHADEYTDKIQEQQKVPVS